MTLAQLMEIVHAAYPDEITRCYFEVNGKKDFGDDLAKFVVKEIRDTYSPDSVDEAQLEEAARCMRVASEQLSKVHQALIKALSGKTNLPQNSIVDPFVKEGMEAFQNGYSIDECPHYDGSDAEYGWKHGWIIAERHTAELENGGEQENQEKPNERE